MDRIEEYNEQLEGAFDLIRNLPETDFDNIPVDPAFAGLNLGGADAPADEELIAMPNPTERASELDGRSSFTLAERGYRMLPDIEKQRPAHEMRFAERSPKMVPMVDKLASPKGIDVEKHPKMELYGVKVYEDNYAMATEQVVLRRLGYKGIFIDGEKYWVEVNNDLPRLIARLLKDKVPFVL